MWANINHLVRNIPKLRLFVVASLLVGLLASFAQPVFAADLTGTWAKTDQGLTALRVGTSLYFNPGKEGTHWYMTENAAGVKCQSKVEFSDNPFTNADAAKSGTQRFYKEVAEGAGTTGCLEKTGDANNVTISGTPGSATTDPGNGAGTGAGATATPKCDVGGLSFAICPLINFMADATEWTAHVLQSILYIQPLPLNGSNDLFTAWASILTIANVVLAIAFVFVIFSQATSMALSSYGIKKMLPRIIAAAILMNLSYYICALMVDLSNLAGVGISGFFAGILQGNIFTDPSKTLSNSFGNHTITEVAAGAGVGAIIIFFFLVPVLLAALAVLFTLAARIAIIVLLVMVAPLAFAAWVLPNTEKYFKKWYELFFNMLMIFPLVMGTFAAAAVASQLIQSTTIQGVNPDGATGDFAKTVLLPLIALLVQAMPLFALPFLFKVAGGTLARLNGFASNGIQNRLGGKQAGEFASGFRKRQMSNVGARMAANERRGPLGSTGRFIGGYKARRNFKMNSQKANVEHLQQEATAKAVLESNPDNRFGLVRGAAGAATNRGGVDRAMANAITVQRKAEMEDISNKKQLLAYEADAVSQPLKEFTKAAISAGPSGQIETTMANGQKRMTRMTPAMFEAAVDQAAELKEIPSLEKVRSGAIPGTNQSTQDMLSRAIARHDGTIKSGGGFHIATDFNLTPDKYLSTERDESGRVRYVSAATRTAEAGNINMGEFGINNAMDIARVQTLAGSSATDVGSMKYGQFQNVADSLGKTMRDNNGDMKTVFETLSNSDRQAIASTLSDVINNPTARANAGDRLGLVVKAANAINTSGAPERVRISDADIANFTNGNNGGTTSGPAGTS